MSEDKRLKAAREVKAFDDDSAMANALKNIEARANEKSIDGKTLDEREEGRHMVRAVRAFRAELNYVRQAGQMAETEIAQRKAKS